jgi:hypothetical protein
MNTAEFRELVQHRTDAQLLDPCLYDQAAPFVFEPMPTAWDLFRSWHCLLPHIPGPRTPNGWEAGYERERVSFTQDGW